MSNSISISTIKELFEYNYWARDRQLNVCAVLDKEQYHRSLGSSFSSIHETFVHMAAVEWLWLERWLGNSPKGLFKAKDYPALSDITRKWQTIEKDMKQFLSGLNEDILEETRTYTGTRGNVWTYPLWKMIMHLLNHQSYHCGQITTMIRQLGCEPARVDFLVGLDEGFCII